MPGSGRTRTETGAPAPGSRRAARALAAQILYALDGRGDDAVARSAVAGWGEAFEIEVDAAGRAFAEALVARALAEAARIDELIAGASRNWRLERMARVDRNILRLGTAELLAPVEGDEATPVRVVINEAIELARRFGTAESGAFVNGILDRVATALGRVADAPEA